MRSSYRIVADSGYLYFKRFPTPSTNNPAINLRDYMNGYFSMQVQTNNGNKFAKF